MRKHPPRQVGAPDPEKKNSPILDETSQPSQDKALESGVCYFNGVAYPVGNFVLSGDELLRCEERGLWVRKGEMLPD
jgi:hypothetical protein